MRPTCGIVTLLGNPVKSQVEGLWRVLENECGIKTDDASKFVHFSYHVAEGYDLDQLMTVIREIAREIKPFKVRTAGLGLFSGEKPVLYLPLVKDSQLLQFHELVCMRVSPSARGINPHYAPQNWIPHITLAQDNVNHKRLSCMMGRVVNQDINWEFIVDNIAYVGLDDGHTNDDIRHYPLIGNTSEIYPWLPLSAGSRSGLVVVDMQDHFFKQTDRRGGLEEVIQNINLLIDCFDENKLPVVHAITSLKADGSNWDLKMKVSNAPELIEGEHDTQILPNIQVSERHTVICKTRYSAFFNTELAEFMNKEDIQRVVVVGAYTHYCVNATIFDAYAHDFIPCLVTDAIISHRDNESEMMVARMRRNGYHMFKTSEFLRDCV